MAKFYCFLELILRLSGELLLLPLLLQSNFRTMPGMNLLSTLVSKKMTWCGHLEQMNPHQWTKKVWKEVDHQEAGEMM